MNSDDKTRLPSSSALTLSRNLNALISECGIDGTLLSKHTGVPTTTINRLRKEDPKNNPTLLTLLPIAQFFAITVSQLIGDEPLPDGRISGSYNPNRNVFHSIPIIHWEEAIHWPQKKSATQQYISSEKIQGDHTFSLIVDHSDWQNLIQGTALIIDPTLKPEHRDLALVYKVDQKRPALKTILLEDDQIYLKSLTYGYNISPITHAHKILGVVVEYKKKLK